MPDCTALQEKLNALEDALASLQNPAPDPGDPGSGPVQKPTGVVKIRELEKKIAIATIKLNECLNPIVRGTMFPNFHVLTLLYNPPGIGSNAVYGSGSTAGTTTSATTAFKGGSSLATSGKFFGNGIDISVAFSSGTKFGESFEVKKERSSIISLTSAVDGVDHSRDVFYIWLNAQVDVEGTPGVAADLKLHPTNNQNDMEIVLLTVAELRDQSLIRSDKKQRLSNFKPEDYNSILSLHPLAGGGQPDGRFRFLRRLQLEGPDNPGDGLPGAGQSLNDEKASGVITGRTQQINVGVTVTGGVNLFGIVKGDVSAGLTFEWDYETSRNITTGTKEEASALLLTTTLGYHEVIDVYQDTVFKTLAFVSMTGKIPSNSAQIFGTVFDASGTPIFNEPVNLTLPNGESRTVFTNAQGLYRAFAVPDGDVGLEVQGNLKAVTLKPPAVSANQIGSEVSFHVGLE